VQLDEILTPRNYKTIQGADEGIKEASQCEYSSHFYFEAI
jgi:hypothetical protein